MDLIGFLQIRNELASGHLDRFLSINVPLFDKLYVYDDASDDGTRELIEKYATKVIRGSSRQFGSELKNKKKLLDLVKEECQPGDAIIRLDADEILYCSKEELKTLIESAFENSYDSITLAHRNLWRSFHWFRVDDNYNSFRPTRVWKLSDSLDFKNQVGLHVTTDPIGLRATLNSELYPVIHFGFAEKSLILDKYATYKAHWQSDYPLFRLISEEGLQLEKLDPKSENLGARFAESHKYSAENSAPSPLTSYEWLASADNHVGNFSRGSIKPKVTLVSLIYSSVSWLEFQYAELLRMSRDLPQGEVEILFIANDPSDEVVNFLVDNAIPHIVVSTKLSDEEWFINSVYRAYNLGVEYATTEYVLLVNSDMAYSKGALSSLMKQASPDVFIASRLVELGVMPSGKYGVEKDFGSKPKTFRKKDFEKYALSISRNCSMPGGLYMPLLVNRQKFLSLGGFPHGNLLEAGLQKYVQGGDAHIGSRGDSLVSGDAAFMQKAANFNVAHITAFDSIAYHFQAGERRDLNKKMPRTPSGIAVVNDSLTGINNEEVLWGRLVEGLRNKGLKVFPVEIGYARNPIEAITASLRLSGKYIRTFRSISRPRVAISNATYNLPTPRPARRVVIRQDSPTTLGYRLMQRLTLWMADHIIANDPDFVAARQGRKTSWLALPLGRIWWTSQTRLNAIQSKDRKFIFVGAFNEIKGWPRLRQLAMTHPEVNWTFVTKYAADVHGLQGDRGPNWEVLRAIPQVELKELMREATALIVASPYETQCLAALEAASQGVPVLTTPTGILGSAGQGLHEFGLVTSELERDFDLFLDNLDAFKPRKFVESLGLVSNDLWETWIEIMLVQLQQSFLDAYEPNAIMKFMDRLRAFAMDKARLVTRQFVIPRLLAARTLLNFKRPS